MKLLLVDGSNLLFQMFYGMPARILGKQGQPVHGTLGFLGALLKVIRMTIPTHAAVFFDGEHENPRTLLDENYKANRPNFEGMSEQETPFSQLPDIFRCLEHLKIPYLETVDCETDDLVAAYAHAFGESMEIDILSFDSDFFQLISKNVSVLRYRGKLTQRWDKGYLYERLGVEARQYADYKSLTGDASDNIPGVPHVGPKTAAKLMHRFGSLDTLFEHLDEISQPALRTSLKENRERVIKNKALIRLDGAVPLPFSMESLAYIPTEKTSVQILRELDIL